MRNLMKLVAVAAVLTMLASMAVAGDFQRKGFMRLQADGSSSRDFDCGAAIEIPSISWPGAAAVMPSVSGVDTWYTLPYDYSSSGELVYHFTFPANATGWDWNFTYTHSGSGYIDAFVGWGPDCGYDYISWVFWGTGTGGTASYGNDTDPVGFEGDLWIVLDGEDGFGAGELVIPSFYASEHVYVPPPPVDFCATIEDVTGSGLFTGDTCDGGQTPVTGSGTTVVLIPPSSVVYLTDGLEDYFGVFMPAGSSFNAHVTADCDPSLRVFDNCANPVANVGYMDYYYPGDASGFEYEEFMPFTNDTGVDAYFYLVIDAYDDCCGSYELDFTSTGGAIANEEMSMGEVKALYR